MMPSRPVKRWIGVGATAVFFAGAAIAVVGSSGTDVTLAQLGAGTAAIRFPSAIYPVPVPPKYRWGSPGKCASTAHVQSPGAHAARFAVQALTRMDGHLSHDLYYADRAYWPVLKESDQSYKNLPHEGRLTVERASKSSFAPLVKNNCGASIVKYSIDIVYAPKTGSSAVGGQFWMLKRDGHWLLWFTN